MPIIIGEIKKTPNNEKPLIIENCVYDNLVKFSKINSIFAPNISQISINKQ